MGFSADCAFSGSEALSHLRKNKPGLVLLDYMMPDMNGLEVLAEVKSDVQTAGIPVVMLTAVSDDATAKSAMGQGAVAFWVKGHIDYDRLRQDVSRFVTPG
jgi:CheY-like chemotaxis protein